MKNNPEFAVEYDTHIRGQPQLTAECINGAENYWIKVVQQEVYTDEINQLEKELQLNRNSDLRMLNHFLDIEGRLRVGGRLQFSQEAEVKHPILLPPLHELTTHVIKDFRRRTVYGGLQDTLTELREKFWVRE